MKDVDSIVSGFDSDAGNEAAFAVDFAAAKPLAGGGSTCDAFECIVQRRRVFVKRLKAEYRQNPLYRAAFDKEFDLGVSLSHPSLPRYVGFGGDYIVMDFVEGDTLADLIRRGDRRLKSSKFTGRLLSELIDVVEYLHYRNVVHCDIKADNIIISPYPGRPATLIDFDKAYSPWLDSTHGNAGRYGCDGCADGAVDFRGIGLIAAKLGRRRLADACGSAGVSADSLRRLLPGRKMSAWPVLAVVAAVAAGAVAAIAFLHHEASPAGEVEVAEPVAEDSAIVASAPPEAAPPAPPAAFDSAWLHALIAEKSAEIKEYRLRLWAMLDCDTISLADKTTAIMEYGFDASSAIVPVISSAVSHHGHMSEPDVQNAVRSDSAWLRLVTDEEAMQARLRDWQAKESQRSSGRPASPPDTLPDDSLRAPRR